MSEEDGPHKKRRRSSLARSKNKLDPTPTVRTGLHKSTEKYLSTEERIEQLCTFCIQCAVDHVTRDCDSDRAKKDLNEVSQILLECLQRTGMKEARSAVCHIGNVQPNPANSEMDMAIQDMVARTNRLKREEEGWNKLVTDLEDKAALTESSLTDQKTVSGSELPEEQRKLCGNYLQQMASLQDIRTDVTGSTKSNKLLVREHEKWVSCTCNIEEEISASLENETAVLRSRTFGGLESPRSLIQHEFPTPPLEPR